MGNINTSFFRYTAGPNQNNIVALTNAVAGTTETAISLAANAFSGLGGGVMVGIIESGLLVAGQQFRIRANGTVTTGTTTNLTIKLYQVPLAIMQAGTQGTLANDNSLGSSGAIAVNTTSQNFSLDATLIWDATSGRLNGSIKFQIGASFVAETNITAVTGLTLDTSMNFLLSAQFSASNAANVLQIQEFMGEQV
jgi:hypothetical protein